ncbi:MAG: FHA domain-containing protein [Rhodomicrobium sp.]
MSLASSWIMQQVKAAGEETKPAKRCLIQSTQSQMTYIIGGIAALLSIATLLFAFRRTPAVQTVFGRAGGEQAPMPSSERGGPSPAGSATGRYAYAGDGSAVRLTPTGAGQPIALPVERLSSPGGCVIGRESGNDGRIDEKTVSKRHARLILDDGGRLFIEDLGSSNGTWKKGAKITRDAFASGDTVRFGAVEFRIELPASGAGTQRFDGSGSDGKTEKVGGATAAAGSGAVYAWLERLDASGQKIAVKKTTVTIGRHEDNDLRFEEPTVHRRHAVLHITPQREFIITDLSGAGGNGVKVNSKKVEKAELHDGDVIELSTVRLKFHGASI